jgi:FSR family fosmidomycin resistance protein-like MFS transporter
LGTSTPNPVGRAGDEASYTERVAPVRDDQPGEGRSSAYLLLAGLTVGHLVNDFYTMVLPPLIPALRQGFGLNYLEVGFLSFCFSILSGLLQPSVGHVADAHGLRKRLVITGFLVFCAGFVAMSFASSYGLLLVATLFCGLGATTFHPQATNFLTRAFPRTRGWAMGIHGWGGSIGNFLAPLVVAFLASRVGWRQAVTWLVVPGLLTAVFLWGFLDEPARVDAAGGGSAITRDLVLVAVTFGFLAMVLRGFLTFLPTFLVERGTSLAQAGVFTSLMLLVGLVAQPLGGHVYDRVGGRAIFFVCSVGAGLGLVVFTAGSGAVLLVGAALVGFSVFALFPVSLAMGSEIAKDGRVGVAVGVVFGVSATMAAMTPVLTGFLADLLGLSLAFQLLTILAVLAAALSVALPGRPMSAMPIVAGSRAP